MHPQPIPPAIVLVRPQMAENIGSAARAMVNFGACDLRLVDPRPYDPAVALRLACDGRAVLEKVRHFPDLNAALTDCAFTVATSRRPRRIKLEAIKPNVAVQRLWNLPPTELTALVFGAEQSGLTNEELYLCDITSTIPTTETGSLNLGQAVVVYLYEWYQAGPGKDWFPDVHSRLATHGEKKMVYDLLSRLLLAGEYKPRERLPEFMRRFKLLFEERPLTEREQRILLKALRHLEKLLPVK
jgi:tRNA/rRNA methyltransferase